MKFTIITVCYNAQQHIRETIESVLCQTYTDFQYIIKDGQSTDDTLKIIEQLVKDDKRVVVESSEDKGIYAAMNQALAIAEGEYIFFLNAGDVFHDSDVLKQTFSFAQKYNADVLYGDIILKNSDNSRLRKYRKSYRYSPIYLLGDCICHQAMFAKKDLFVEKLFDTKYKICADRDWQMYYLKRDAFFKPVEFAMADVMVDGFSLQNVDVFEEEAEACLKQHYPRWSWLYRCFTACKKNALVRKILNLDRRTD